MTQNKGGISGSREPSPSCTGLGPAGFDPGRARDLAEILKQTVRLARVYSHGTGRLFEDAMTSAERIAELTILECEEMTNA